ncbi:MAG: histidine kinase dimerization/phospho-acceptor domain-containing protein, partial [bacterium]
MGRPEGLTSEGYLKLISAFAVDLLQRSTLDEIFWLIADRAIAGIGFDDCVIYLLDRATGELVQVAAYGPKSPEGRVIVDPITIPLGEGVVGSVARNLKPERIRDTRLDSRYILDDEFRLSELAVPIVLDGECLGVIDSENLNVGFYTEKHEEILVTIASMAATKISDAKREEELHSTVRKLKTVQNKLATQAVELINAKDIADSSNRAKSAFLATMSHEIRTPLTALVGYAELLTRSRGEEGDREAWMKGLRRGSNHLLALVNDILDLSKIEAGKMQVSLSPQSPLQVLRQVVQLMRPQAKEKMLYLSLELSGNLPRTIVTDDVRLRQILVNLVG